MSADSFFEKPPTLVYSAWTISAFVMIVSNPRAVLTAFLMLAMARKHSEPVAGIG